MGLALRFMESVGLREPDVDEYDEETVDETVEPLGEVHEFPSSTEKNESHKADSPETSGVKRIRTAKPTSYADCKEIGNSLREGVPVILNLNYMPNSEAQRMVDFTLGLCYGVRGHFEEVGTKVLLLSPESLVPEVDEPAKLIPRSDWR